MKNVLRIAFLLLFNFSFSYFSKACSPILVPTLVSQNLIGTNLELMWSSNTIYNSCTYLVEVEIVCNTYVFPGNGNPPFFLSSVINKTTTPYPYPLQSIDISGLCPGTIYQFRARERSSTNVAVFSPWTATFSFTTPGVFVQPTITVSASPTSVCFPQTSQLDCLIQNGCGLTAPTYSWSPSASLSNANIANPVASPTTTTTYTCTVTGGMQGCWTASATVTITSAVAPVAGTASVSPSSVCSGNPATLTVIGSVGAIQWQSAPTSTGPWANIVGATSSPYVTGPLSSATCFQAIISGCSSDTTNIVCITINQAVTSTQSFTNLTCNGVCVGVGTITPVPAGTYTYVWSPNVGSTATVSGLCAGSYTISATDPNGCITTQSFTITQPPAISATTTHVNVLCNGGATGSATVVASGGTGTLTYNWTPSGGTNASANNLATGTYTCTITDASGCITTQTVNITQPTMLSVSTTSDSVCPGGNGTVSAVGSGGVGPYTYLWSNGATTSSQNLTVNTDSTLTVSITDANGCTVVGTAGVELYPVPSASFTSNTVNGTYQLTAGIGQLCFTNTSIGAMTWVWDLNGNPSIQPLPCVPVTYADTGIFCTSIFVANSNGCLDTSTVCILIGESYYSIPNVFTPNNDGTNDGFVITNRGMKSLRCEIYDRWGILVYQWDGTTGYWDGKAKNGNVAVDGVYYYTAHLVDLVENPYEESGFVELISGK